MVSVESSGCVWVFVELASGEIGVGMLAECRVVDFVCRVQ